MTILVGNTDVNYPLQYHRNAWLITSAVVTKRGSNQQMRYDGINIALPIKIVKVVVQ